MENYKSKILIFSTAYAPFWGGAEVAIKEITDRLPEIEFHLVTAKLRKTLPFREKVGNITVYRLGIGTSWVDKLILPFEAALFARHLKKKNKYDFYWGIMVTFASVGAYINNLFSKHKIPIILTLQEGDSEKYLKTKWLGLIDLSWQMALKRTNILTVISTYLGERAKKMGYKGEIKLIPNGVDVEKFTQEISNEEKKKIRIELGLKEGDVALITSSRLNIKNGVGDVIKALAKLPENVKFIVLGAGELRGELVNMTDTMWLNERVIFKGFIDHAELPKYLKSSDIFIRPSLSEGMGNSFIEAFAAKIPVIATPVGGIVDFLKDPASQSSDGTSGQTGYFCKPQNPDSIAETVKRVIADPNKEKIIENAYKLAVSEYNWDEIAREMKEIFNRLG